MKYVVKKPIPISGLINKNNIIDSEDPKYKYLDFNNTEFFEEYDEPMYSIGQELIYFQKFCKVKHILSNKRFELLEEGTGLKHIITDKTKVTTPTKFWFINSNGIVIPDFEERKNLNKEGLVYKKTTGNYFKTALEANKRKAVILNDLPF